MEQLVRYGNTSAVTEPNMLDAFRDFLRLDVANGDASADTIRGYKTQVGAWVRWCSENNIQPSRATQKDIKDYRQFLVSESYKPSTIAYKLTILRRFYAAAVDNGLRRDNPATGIKPPKAKRAQDDFHYLSEVDITLLFRAIGNGASEKELRDKTIIAMMGLQGLRTVEIERANVEDIKVSGEHVSFLVRGKNHDRIVYLRPDVADIVSSYLSVRQDVLPDGDGIPLFTACGNRAGGTRISRRGIRQVVDFYLKKADLKRPGISDHALRHTAATLAYKYTQDLRGVQEMLGHADPKTTARYAHVIDRMKNNPALAVPVQM